MPRPIQAAVFTESSGKHCEIQNLLLADPGPNELVIKVKACGICHTDLSVADSLPRPSILGHETAGEVVEVGTNVTQFAIGDRVTATFSSCRACATCEDNRPAYCIDHIQRNFGGVQPDGNSAIHNSAGNAVFSSFFQQSGFADYALVQTDNVVKIPDALSYEMAAPLGCGVQTGYGSISNSLAMKKEQSIVVFGVGAVGLSAIMAAHKIGCKPIIAVDLDESRLQLAEELGAHTTLRGDTENLTEKIKELTSGGAHCTLEATGVESIYHAAVNSLRPGGTCGTLAYPGNFGEPVMHPGGYAFMDTHQMGIIEGDSVPETFIPELAESVLDGSLPCEKLVTTFPFADINEALDAARENRVIKAVLVFDT